MSVVAVSSGRYWAGFDPRSIGGCKLWLDAADSRTVILSGANVTQWLDKSGQGLHMTTHDPFGYPTVETGFLNGLNVLNFSRNMMTSAYGLAYSLGDMYLVLSSKVLGGVVSNNVAGLPPLTSFAGPYLQQSNGNWNARLGSSSISLTNTSGNEDPSASTFVLLNWTAWRGNSSLRKWGRDVSAVSPSPSSNTTERFSFGASDTSALQVQANCLQAYVAEVLLYSNTLDLQSRQSIEGYLTWKWGLETPRSFTPLSFPGCRLWLDATDICSGTKFSDGANIVIWKDKSGNGNDASATNIPVYDVCYQGVAFRNGPYMRLPTGCLATPGSNPMTWAVVVTCPVYPTALPRPGIFGITDPSSLVMCMGINRAVDLCGTAISGIRLVSGQGVVAAVRPADQRQVTVAIYSNARYFHLDTDGYRQGSPGDLNRLKDAGSNVVLGAAGPTGQNPFSGIIHEVVAYNTELTAVQRQQLEAYLSRKWQIDGPRMPFLPYTHPLAGDPPRTRPLGPADVSSVALWLDAGQRSTVQLNSVSRVSNWVNLSRYGRSVSNALTSGNYGPGYSNSINGIPVLSFNGTSFTSGNSLSNANFHPIPQQDFFMFAVARPTVTDVSAYGNTNLVRVMDATGQTRSVLPFYDVSRNRQLGYALLQGASLSLSADATSVAGQTDVLGVVLHSLDVSASVVTRTGAISRLWGFASGTSPFRLWIGSVSGNTEFYAGDVGEIIVGDTRLNSTRRQQMEGYLAWKWGLQGRLPSIHSCANVPPTVIQFTPSQLPNLVTWYDFSDTRTQGVRGRNNAAYVLAKDICGQALVQRRDTSQGLFDLSGPNGQPVLHLRDQSSVSIATRKDVNWTYTSTLFLIHRTHGSTATGFDAQDQTQFSGCNGVVFRNFGTQASLTFHARPTGSRVITSATATYPPNTWFLTTVVNSNRSRDISDANWRINGVRQVVTFTASTDAFAGTTFAPLLFNRRGGYGNTVVGEILWFNRALTDYEVDLVECWLAQKWGNPFTWTSSGNLFRNIIV